MMHSLLRIRNGTVSIPYSCRIFATRPPPETSDGRNILWPQDYWRPIGISYIASATTIASNKTNFRVIKT